MSAPESARARVRAELTAEILGAARAELADSGAAALSLRAVARRLGMVPSALYRYFPSRDSLLTALIVEAYEEVGAVAEEAVAGRAGGPPLERWSAACTAVRGWARDHAARWSLIYGSPVPGYAAPDLTVPAALRITEVLAGLVREAVSAPAHQDDAPRDDHLHEALTPLRETLMPGRPDGVVVGALLAWTGLIGMVSLELFGHYKGGTTDFDAVFAAAMAEAGRLAGLAAAG